MALNEKGLPNIGPFTAGGVPSVDSKTHEITSTCQYWALAHYSRAAGRGARRFDSQGQVEKVSHVALVQPDRSQALVLTNTGAERKICLRLADMAAEITLPQASVLTLTWE